MINKLIGSDTLPGDVLETTTKIYRIKYSETIKVQTFKHGCKEDIDHPCNSLEEIQSMLEDFEDEVKRDDTICQIDVYMPFSKIRVNRQLVQKLCYWYTSILDTSYMNKNIYVT